VVEQREILGKDFCIYGDIENPKFLAKDVADWIDYSASNVSKLMDVVDDDEKLLVPMLRAGQNRDTWFVTEDGLYEILMMSRKPIAKTFKKKVKEILKTIRTTGHYETPEYKLLQSMNAKLELQDQRIEALSSVISDSIWSEPVTNPRYDFELYNGWYKDTTKDASHRGLFEAIGDYFGIYVPYSGEVKPITLTQWLIDRVTLDEIKRFVIGIKKKYIVKNELNHWINLNGFGSNNVEFKKVLKYFDESCAYCDDSNSVLIPEHIIGQNQMASSDPTKVDLVGNIVCSCGECNASKGTQEMEQWYRRQAFYNPSNLKKIQRHIYKYEV